MGFKMRIREASAKIGRVGSPAIQTVRQGQMTTQKHTDRQTDRQTLHAAVRHL